MISEVIWKKSTSGSVMSYDIDIENYKLHI